MMYEKDLTKSEIQMLIILEQFPEGILRPDLYAIYNKVKTVEEVKFEYSIQKFDLRKNANKHP